MANLMKKDIKKVTDCNREENKREYFSIKQDREELLRKLVQ